MMWDSNPWSSWHIFAYLQSTYQNSWIIFPDKATEDAIAQSILKKNMTQLMTIIFKDVLGNDNIEDHERVQNVVHRFTQTFDRVIFYLKSWTIRNNKQIMNLFVK